MSQKVETKHFFIAVITDKFLSHSATYLKICQQVSDEKYKPMYVIVKEGVNWDEFKHFPWRDPSPLFFDTEEEFDRAFELIKKDVDFYKKIQAM